MNEILKAVLSLSLSGSLLILLLFLLRPLFKERLSKRWQYYIWLVVIARLLLPFAPETNLMVTLFQGIDRTIEQTEIVFPYTQQGGITDIPQTDDMENGQNNLHSGQTEPVESASNHVRNIITVLWKNLWLGWLVVALILFIRKITVYQDFVKYIRAGCVEVAEIDLLERFGKLIERNKVKTTVELYTNNLISSPLLIGFFRPSIILPSADLSPVDFEYTILHELTHYKRRDMFYKWLVQFSVCVHWFNPLVYLMSREVSRVCELSCDETVIRALDLQERRAYGDTLLNAMGAGGNYKNSLASVTLNESKELLKERLDAIMNFKQISKSVTAITILCTMVFCVGATAIGAYAAPADNIPSTPWEAMGDSTGQPYTYSQSSYYEAPYIFEMGWNLNDKGYNSYPDKAEIMLSDKTVIIVSFDNDCKEYAQNDNILSNLKNLLEKLKDQNASSSLPLEKPLIVSVKDVGNSDLKNLAEEYYTNHTITSFVAIFPALNGDTQKIYCDKMFNDNQNAFFAAILKNLDTTTINYYAEKSYEENKLTFFTNIVPYLTEDAKQSWVVKSSQDKRNTFLAVLTNAI